LELDLPEEILKGNPAKGISGFWSDDDEVMATGKVKVIDVESRILHGQPIFLSTIKVPLRDANGEIWGVLGYARDITEREQLLHQAERLYKANQRINEAQDLQEVIAAIAEALDIHAFNRMILIIFEYNTTDELTGVSVAANWHSGEGKLPTSIGTRYSRQDLTSLDVFLSAEPLFFDDAQQDERFDGTTKEILKALSIQSLAVLPLWTGGRQLGSFVMEAEERHHFTEREIQPCLALASQAAVAVDNQRLLEETRAALAEVEATQRLYTIQAWETYRTRTATRSYERNQPGIEPLGDNLPPEVSQAVANRQVVATSGLVDHQQNGDQSLAKEAGSNLIVPLTIRNEIIGVLGLQDLDQTRHWSPEEIALVQAIGDQLAQAAENLRLIDATQQRAAREQRVNEIGEKIQAAQSLEEALQVAVKEVGLSLNAPQSRVQLSIKYIENDKDYQGEGFLR
jgi:GAF domain-containing protein